jgi:hypothetical protein
MLQWLYMYVANVYSQCFIYIFKRMLQVCLAGRCICFHTYVASILSGCCICFAMGFKYISCVFLQVFRTYVLNVLAVFRRMLQVMHLNVSKSRLDVAYVAT